MAGRKAEKPPNFERKPFLLFLRLHVAEKRKKDTIQESILEEKSKKFTARTGGKFAVNDSFFGEKIC